MLNRIFLGFESEKTINGIRIGADRLHQLLLLSVSWQLDDNVLQYLIRVGDEAMGHGSVIMGHGSVIGDCLEHSLFIEWSRRRGRFYVRKYP